MPLLNESATSGPVFVFLVVFAVMLLQSAEFRGTLAGWARRPAPRGVTSGAST